ncbi:type VII secretion-associated protein [Mycobacterium shinjukuense]|uniref:Type VII secretion-associated protein n=1 Tax=Mycobacterium shinjukuense TaxID=398694 RepID=A0A7I7MSI9_9MYCO|nr:type VII secretion-associated protein [Mycobacterium shinjukuense]
MADTRWAAALSAIDDPVALVNERPVAVESLWSDVLRSMAGDHGDGVLLVHPSWWSTSRVDVITRAARDVTKDVVVRPRSWLLTRARRGAPAGVLVEIAERFVVVRATEVVAVRRRHPDPVAEEVARAVAGMAREPTAVVLIDVPSGVAGARRLATAIAGAVRDGSGHTVVEIDDARLMRLASAAASPRREPGQPAAAPPGSRARPRLVGAGVAAAGLAVALLALTAKGRPPAPSAQPAPTTFLVEGRVALTVPADWPTQRVLGGPGSARVQVTSPTDPEVALHITQSPVVGETLADTAASLQRAIDAEPAGVFVDFNPSGVNAGRPAVTYREVRPGHHVWWTVLLDGAVRISVGCQSRPGALAAVRDACERAVRSAHTLG